jgi:hypothetical protein
VAGRERAGAAYVGFTASTGNGFENHDILNWSFTRPEVSSILELVSSQISFLKNACLPDRNLCTPDQAVIDTTGPGVYHIVLPANLEWGASIPNPSSRPVTIQNARGIACWNLQMVGPQGCNGPTGNRSRDRALITRTEGGRTWFSIVLPQTWSILRRLLRMVDDHDPDGSLRGYQF